MCPNFYNELLKQNVATYAIIATCWSLLDAPKSVLLIGLNFLVLWFSSIYFSIRTTAKLILAALRSWNLVYSHIFQGTWGWNIITGTVADGGRKGEGAKKLKLLNTQAARKPQWDSHMQPQQHFSNPVYCTCLWGKNCSFGSQNEYLEYAPASYTLLAFQSSKKSHWKMHAWELWNPTNCQNSTSRCEA